jgi:hypothetical protein
MCGKLNSGGAAKIWLKDGPGTDDNRRLLKLKLVLAVQRRRVMNKKLLLVSFLSGLVIAVAGCSNWEDSRSDVGEFVGELKSNGVHPVAARQPSGPQQVERVQGALVLPATATPAPRVAVAEPRYFPARPVAPPVAPPPVAKVDKPVTQDAAAPETRKAPTAAARPATARRLRRDVVSIGELGD